MIRQTSIETYNKIEKEGLLSKMRLKVYKAIVDNAPCTSGEASATFENKRKVPSQLRARFTELRELGVIKEDGTKICSITGRKAIKWDLTGNLPEKIHKNDNPKPRQLKASIKYITNVMHKEGAMFYTQEELEALLEK